MKGKLDWPNKMGRTQDETYELGSVNAPVAALQLGLVPTCWSGSSKRRKGDHKKITTYHDLSQVITTYRNKEQ